MCKEAKASEYIDSPAPRGNRVYLLNSPFQVLSAFEHFRTSRSDEDATIFHVQSGPDSSVSQTRATLDCLALDYETISPSGRTRLKKFSTTIRKTRCVSEGLRSEDTLVIGNLGYDVFADAVCCSPAARKVCLDDGLKTVLLWNAARVKNGACLSIQQQLKSFFFGVSKPEFESLKYFSLFQGQEPEWACVDRNEFQILRREAVPSRKKEIILLGQPMLEDLLYYDQEAANKFQKRVNAAKEQFPHAKVKYYAHRNENAGMIYDIIKGVDEIVYPNLPIELYLLKKSVQPVALLGLFSTALFSISQIFCAEAPSVTFLLPDRLGQSIGKSKLRLFRRSAAKFFQKHSSQMFFIT